MEKKREIKTSLQVPIGYIIDEGNGNQRATDFFGRVLGFYKANVDQTTDFLGVPISRGNILSSLIHDNYKNKTN